MKIGCCTNMIATGPDGTGVEFVEKLAGLGFDYIELPLAELSALSDEAFEQLAGRVERSGIRCETCNNFFPRTMRLTGPDVDQGLVDAYVEKALSRAQRLGVEYVVFGSGPAKNVPAGFSMEEGYQQVVQLLKRVEPVAARHGVTIVIEPLRRAECNLINSFAEGCKLAKDAGCEHVKVLVDYYHMTEEKEPLAHLKKDGADFLRHVHFARYEGRGYPAESGQDRGCQAFFQALAAAGYDRRISLEAYSDNFDEQAPGALRFLKSSLQNND